jgi:predicted permease
MSLGSDLRYAARGLVRSPGFTAAAVASLAIGVGASTAIFSVVRDLLVRPLAGIAEPERLVAIGRTESGQGFDSFGYPDLLDFRAQSRTLDRVFAYDIDAHAVSVGESTRRALGYAVSSGYFEAHGVRAAHGRLFLDAEDSPAGGAPVAVVSHGFFERELGGDAARVGTPIRVDGHDLTLVGVVEPGFGGHFFGLRPEIYVPLSTPLSTAPFQLERLSSRESVWLHLGGRLAPGATLDEARAEIAGIAARLVVAYPESHATRGAVVVAAGPLPGAAQRPVALFAALLFALVGLVLGIACLNVASMLLARTEERAREVAVRQALGAPRRRLVRQLLTESVLLFGLAAPPGLLLARAGVGGLAAVRPPTPFPVFLDFGVDWTAALFALALSLGTGLLFGLAPALHGARRPPGSSLHDGSAGAGTRRLRLRRSLVGAQLAMSLLLLVLAGLLLRAVNASANVDPGFRAAGVTAYELDLERAGLQGESARIALAELLERARRIPGVESVSASRVVPLGGTRVELGPLTIDGQEGPEDGYFRSDANIVAPGFFATLGVPLEGRDFSSADRESSEPVAIVNRTFAERFFPQGALDRVFHLGRGEDRTAIRIVGVARDLKSQSLGEPARTFYWLPVGQAPAERTTLLVRRAEGLPPLEREIDSLARSIDPDLPAGRALVLTEVAALSTLPQRLAASVAAAAGAVGLFLAAVGLYGVVAFAVAARRREMAVRMALGAQPGDVVRFVLRDSAPPVLVGAAVGLLLAFALSRLLDSLLFGLSPTDLATFVGVPALLGAVALVAVLVPARRAAATAPAAALRAE